MSKEVVRKDIWEEFEKLEIMLKNLKAVVQNDMPYNEEVITEFIFLEDSFIHGVKEVCSYTHEFMIKYPDKNNILSEEED